PVSAAASARRLSGGQAVVEGIRREGVRHVFCVPGESYLAALDAFYDTPEITLIVNRQEGGAAFMAEAYGKATRHVGVVFVTRGPGATNASIGVHAADQDSTPLVLFVGQVPRAFRGREAFQEMDYGRFFGGMAKWVVELQRVGEIPGAVHRAFHLARSGRPGPVVVVLPEDVLTDEAELTFPPPRALSPPHPDPVAVGQWIEALNAAQRPAMIVGGGIQYARARRELVAFSERFQAPVLTGFRRMDAFPNGHPHYLGNLGLGKSPAQDVVREADLVVALGTRLPEMTTADYTLPTPGQRLIHIDIHGPEIGKVFPAELGLVADARLALQAALEHPPPPPNGARAAWIRGHRETFERYTELKPRAVRGVPMERVMADLNAALPADAILTVDAGNFSGWIHRYRSYEAEDSFLGPTLGSMGYGLPSAIGAKLAHPGRVVVGNCGDGGFLMTLQELATAVQHGVNVIQLVYNNGSFGTIRMHQERDFPGRTVGTDLQNPDFAALATSFGALGLRATEPDEFRPALEQALAADRPAVIEVTTDLEAITTTATLSELRAQR
ncbi:MAG: thiamine pyrophosphate-dependent enzyme, partial [bacterium]